jgi:3-hydroxyisobutyrate dehydrogenase-like beta-hydroxyacid dehydrogenase
MSVSLLGLGPMGEPMARNLLAGLGSLTVWNRTASKADGLEALGAVVAATPREAAADVTLTVLPDLPQVRALLDGDDGLLAGWAERGIEHPILVVHGTVSPVAVADFAAELADVHGVSVVDAPLSGGTVGAHDGTLSIMVGGDPSVLPEVLPLFTHMGRTVRVLGGSGAGELAKACNQIVVAGVVSAVSEAMLLARSSGLDLAVLRELLQGGLAATAVLRQKGDNWIDEDFVAGGSAKNQLKDLRFIEEATRERGLDLPVTATVTDLFQEMIDEGLGELDHTGVYLTLEGRGGHDD